jgi:large conductance mechanosensitive channel
MSTPNRANLSKGFESGKAVTKSYLDGFKAFLLRGNVVDLAVGIVIGAAFKSIIDSFVADIITPLVPTPGGSLSNLNFKVPWTGTVANIGNLVNSLMSFLIVATLIYFFIVQPMNAFMKRYKPHETALVEERDCPYCFSSIPRKATRCSHCTSEVTPVADNA